MSHLPMRLPAAIEIGAVRVEGMDGLEVVTKDNLRTVRNSRVTEDPRRWEVSVPTTNVGLVLNGVAEVIAGDTTNYNAVRQLWADTERGLHTFDFDDPFDGVVYKVRFESPLQITAPAGHLRHIDTFTIVEDDE
jgi:hypothetical protein